MNLEALVFCAAFGLSATAGLLASGCSSSDCNCPENPERPTPHQGPLERLKVVGFDAAGEFAPLDVAPEEGTLEVARDTVTIRYRQAGVAHEVVYDVTGPGL